MPFNCVQFKPLFRCFCYKKVCLTPDKYCTVLILIEKELNLEFGFISINCCWIQGASTLLCFLKSVHNVLHLSQLT